MGIFISDKRSRFRRLTRGKVDYDATLVRFRLIEQIKTFECCCIEIELKFAALSDLNFGCELVIIHQFGQSPLFRL